MIRRSRLQFCLLFATLGILVAGPALADAYRVRLVNGNQFVSKYRPVEASFDQNKVLIMTDVGNIISLHQDDIEEIVHDLELKGFGRVINTTTIEVGWSVNDAPVEGDEGAQGQAGAPQQQFAAPRAPVFNNPLVSEPNAGGGIPVSFATSGMVPQN